jgi:hypothetical protein
MNPYESSEEPVRAELARPKWDLYDWSALLIYLAATAAIVAGIYYW